MWQNVPVRLVDFWSNAAGGCIGMTPNETAALALVQTDVTYPVPEGPGGSWLAWQADLQANCCPGGMMGLDVPRSPIIMIIWVLVLFCARRTAALSRANRPPARE